MDMIIERKYMVLAEEKKEKISAKFKAVEHLIHALNDRVADTGSDCPLENFVI